MTRGFILVVHTGKNCCSALNSFAKIEKCNTYTLPCHMCHCSC
uniref:Uncharacterized protein n=1 Tax=Anguilla anguilla TaxID=7936 RepID=A0A0E9RGE2_ANGAN